MSPIHTLAISLMVNAAIAVLTPDLEIWRVFAGGTLMAVAITLIPTFAHDHRNRGEW